MTPQISVRDERRPGHHWADNEVIDIYGPKIGTTGYAVYMYLCRHAGNRTGRCSKKQSDIAAAFGCSPDTVQRHLIKLVDAGLIAIEEGAHRGETHRYLILEVPKSMPQIAACQTAKNGMPDRKMRHAEPQNAARNKEEKDFLQNSLQDSRRCAAEARKLAQEVLDLRSARRPTEDARRKLGRCLGTMNANEIDSYLETISAEESQALAVTVIPINF